MEVYIIFGTFGLIPLFFYAFYRLTLNTDKIIIKKKYKVNNESYIIDHNNIKYKIVTFILEPEYDNSKDFSKIREDKRYTIKYYGINWPNIGSYYKIIDLSRIVK